MAPVLPIPLPMIFTHKDSLCTGEQCAMIYEMRFIFQNKGQMCKFSAYMLLLSTAESCDCTTTKKSRAGRRGQRKVCQQERSGVCTDMSPSEIRGDK